MQTVLQAADAQRLSCVQREAVVAVLDVRLAGHGVEVGLQGELHVVATGLHLREEIKMLQRIEPERYEVYIMTRSGLVKERLQTVQMKNKLRRFELGGRRWFHFIIIIQEPYCTGSADCKNTTESRHLPVVKRGTRGNIGF